MPPEPATWTARGLVEPLADTRFTDVRWFDRLDSTNTYVLDAARAGAPEGLVVVADEQTAGRGRLGRRWESPPGASLLVSVLVRPDPDTAHATAMATALALADAVEDAAGFMPGLKWPNDLVVGDRKLAGVLAESDGSAVVVGAGCNVNWGELPAELAGTATSCDIEVGREVDRERLLVRFLRALDVRLGRLGQVTAEYRSRLETLGCRVRVERADDVIQGEAVGLDPNGALVVVDDEGRRISVHVGDVVHLRSMGS